MERPYFYFWPADWLSDAGLRSCSLEARGLWIDLICLMHQARPYGYLTVPGSEKPADAKTLSRQLGINVRTLGRLLDELAQRKVIERPNEGPMFSRKMVRSEETKEANKRRKNKSRSLRTNELDETVTRDKRDPSRPMSRGSYSYSYSQEDLKDGSLRSPEVSNDEKPPAQVEPEFELESPPSETELAPEPGNPYHFVAFWQDANEGRDFGLRFEPETGPVEFLEAEIERLDLGEIPAKQVKAAAMSSYEAFKATYSKRAGRARKGKRPKTRGSQIHPTQLTEELVAWLRKDLARLKSRPPSFAQSKHDAIDEAFRRAGRNLEREENAKDKAARGH